MTSIPRVVLTAPERIWLQVSDDKTENDQEFSSNEVTWCEDSVLNCEVPYVRADLIAYEPEPVAWLHRTVKGYILQDKPADHVAQFFIPLHRRKE